MKMKRSLRTRLFWAHTCLFLLAGVISVLFTWLELAREGGPLQGTGTADWSYFLAAAAASCVPVLLLGAVSWWLIRRALSPILALTQAAEKINQDSLHQQIPLRGTGDELDRLTSVLNDMTRRLDTAFQEVREFTLHASHELKTPLTILRNGFEQALMDTTLPDNHRDRVANQLDEIERLNRIVSGLTFLTQADAHQVHLLVEDLDMAELVRDAAGEAAILGQTLNLSVNVVIDTPCRVRGDRHRLRQLLLNLTDNAVKYNRLDGYVEYQLRQEGEQAVVTVRSGGRGIGADELPKIFDRFFRSGNSRGSTTEGCGLGLSIARWIAEEHKGSLSAASKPDNTVMTLKVPMAGLTKSGPVPQG